MYLFIYFFNMGITTKFSQFSLCPQMPLGSQVYVDNNTVVEFMLSVNAGINYKQMQISQLLTYSKCTVWSLNENVNNTSYHLILVDTDEKCFRLH